MLLKLSGMAKTGLLAGCVALAVSNAFAGNNMRKGNLLEENVKLDNIIIMIPDCCDETLQTVARWYKGEGIAVDKLQTGGMKIGHYYTAMGYTETTIEDLVNPLKGMTMTANGVVAMLEDKADPNQLAESVESNWEIKLPPEEIAEIRALEPELGLSYALARVVSAYHTIIGWTTHGHTGETVPFWATSNFGAPANVIDNTDLAKIAAEAIDVNLKKTTKNLYVDLDDITGDYLIDTETDYQNPVVKIAD